MARPRISRASAEQDFLLAAWNLYYRGVSGNPWQTLFDEAFPAWQAARNPKSTPGALRVRYREWGVTERNARGVLIEWALRMKLVEATDGNDPRPPEWILDYVSRLCRKSNSPKQTEDRLERILVSGRTFPLSDLILPMEDPQWGRPKESLPEYKRRVRAALKAHFTQLKSKVRGSSGAKGEPRNGKPLSATRTSDVSHYEWVILHRCCGWKQQRIWREYFPHESASSRGDPEAGRLRIHQAIASKEGILRFAPLRKKNPSGKR